MNSIVRIDLEINLEELVLKGHFGLGLEANAGAEDIGQSRTLLSQSIHNGGSRRSKRSLEHVAQDAQDTVEVLELGGFVTVVGSSLPLNTGHHLSHHDEVNNQRRGQKRVLADVEQPVIIS